MQDLYKRLKDLGFEAKYVRQHLLPEWWDDSLSENPVNRAIAEATIFRLTGIPISALRDPQAKLELPPLGSVKLKRASDASLGALKPGLTIAKHAADLLASTLTDLPPFRGVATAAEVREMILVRNQIVDLRNLLDFAWEHGIVVFHLSAIPSGSRKVTGLSLYAKGRPTIVLTSAYDSPAWLAFHLAHELGHILLGHVTSDSQAIVDANFQFENPADDPVELEANQFGFKLLLGNVRVDIRGPVWGLTANRLAGLVTNWAMEHRINPGTAALMYGHLARRMPAAQKTLKLLQLDAGGHSMIKDALWKHLPESIPESTEQCISLMAA